MTRQQSAPQDRSKELFYCDFILSIIRLLASCELVMKIGYFCYNLSGTGPRVRAKNIINAVAERTDHEVVVLTNQPEKVSAAASVHSVSLGNPICTWRAARRCFRDADVVHVPINTYQVLFVRTLYRGPLLAGVGPGIQPEHRHRLFGRILGIDKKMKVLADDDRWDKYGYDTAVCTATIDTNVFYPYDDDTIEQLREDFDIETAHVVLYIGKLVEEQGAALVSEMAKLEETDDITFIVAGDGPLASLFENRDDLRFEGYVDNDQTPDYYNLANVVVAPRRYDNTSNVGLESIACGTPMVTTASGNIESLFRDRGTYVWADRTPEAVLETVRDLLENDDRYTAQVQRGFDIFDEMSLTLDSALETHTRVYKELAAESR